MIRRAVIARMPGIKNGISCFSTTGRRSEIRISIQIIRGFTVFNCYPTPFAGNRVRAHMGGNVFDSRGGCIKSFKCTRAPTRHQPVANLVILYRVTDLRKCEGANIHISCTE